jgi:O-antigen/teichoic acid export membrane protein
MSSLKLNVASGAMLLAVQVAVSFLLAPFYLRTMGAEGYGAWELIVALLSYASLLELGLGAAMIRETAAADGAHDRERISVVFSNSAAVLGVGGLLAAAILGGLSPFAGQIIGSPPDLRTQAAIAMALTAVNVLVTFGVSILAALVMGLREFFFLNNFRMVSIISSAALTYFALSHSPGYGLVSLAAVATVANFVQAIVLLNLVLRRIPLRFSWSLVSWAEIHRLFRFGISSSVLESASRIVHGAAPFVVSHSVGLASVPFFVIGKRIVEYGYSLAGAIGNPLMPHFAAKAAGGRETLREAWLHATKFLQMITLAMPVGLYIFAPHFISLWMGEWFGAQSEIVARILCVGMLFQAFSCNCGALIVSQGLHARLARFAILSAVPCLIATAVLGSYFGLMGVAIGMAAFPTLLSFQEMRLANAILGQTFWTGQFLTMRPYFLPLVVMGLCGFALTLMAPPGNFLWLCAQAAACGIVYLMLAFIFSFTSEERRVALGRFARSA